MNTENNNIVILKSFLGTLRPENKVSPNEDFWKLIGMKGKIIDDGIDSKRVLVLFDKNLDDLGLENHNPIKNSLWIKKTDLEIDINS